MTGPAKGGSRHWKMQRISALVLLPTTLLFIYPFIRSFGSSQSDVLVTYANPLNALAALVLFVTLFIHLHQGLGEVIIDYAHSKRWLSILHAANASFCWVMGLLAVIAIARIALFP